LFAIGIAGCGEAPLTAGTVYAKEYEPAREWTEHYTEMIYIGQTCFGNNTCTPNYMYVPRTRQRYDDPDWRLDIYVTKTDDKGEQTRREGFVYVTPETYEATNIGDWYGKRDNEGEDYQGDLKGG
jgi:hypothetical protein